MRQLETNFVRRDYNFRQIKRTDRIAIYEMTSNDSNIKRYEVILIRKARAGIYPDGSEAPERELYPTDNDWGIKGWTFLDLISASKKFIDLKGRFG